MSTREQFDDLLALYLPIGVAVAALVAGVFLFALVRYRRRGDRWPGQLHGRPRLELAWGLIVAALVGVLLYSTFSTEKEVDALAEDPGLEVDVTAFQWGWRFSYPEAGVSVLGDNLDPPTLTVPTDTTVRFNVVSRDVIHAFWVPELRFKKDVFPDRVNEFDLVFDAGSSTGRCAEFCGLRHADMLFEVQAMPAEEFERWLARVRRTQVAGVVPIPRGAQPPPGGRSSKRTSGAREE